LWSGLEFLRDIEGGDFSPQPHARKMNAAAGVLRLRHWPPRGVYTRWRPRKRFCSGIVCIPPTSERKLSALRSGVCSKLDICIYFLLFFTRPRWPLLAHNPMRTNQFQNGTLARCCARVHRMATPARGSVSGYPSLGVNRRSITTQSVRGPSP
jgi:hypothetical protein